MSDLNRLVQLLRAGLDLEQIAAVTGGDSATIADIFKNDGSLPASGGGGGASIASVRKTNLVVSHTTATPTSPLLLASVPLAANHFFSTQLHTEVAATDGSVDNLALAYGGLQSLSGFGVTPDPLPFSPFSMSGLGSPGGDDQGVNGVTTADCAFEMWGWIDNGGVPGTTDATMTKLVLIVADFGLAP